MFSEVDDLHICICIPTSHCVRIGCAALARCTAADPLTQFSGRVDQFSPVCYRMRKNHATSATFELKGIFRHFSSQTLLNKNRQCCEFWRDAELRVRAVCAVGDTTDEDRWVDLLCCSPQCDTAESCLTNDTLTTFSSSSDCYDDWRRPSPTVRRPSYDASSPFRRCRLLCSYHNASASQRLLAAASYTFLVTFSVLYYVIDSCFTFDDNGLTFCLCLRCPQSSNSTVGNL